MYCGVLVCVARESETLSPIQLHFKGERDRRPGSWADSQPYGAVPRSQGWGAARFVSQFLGPLTL